METFESYASLHSPVIVSIPHSGLDLHRLRPELAQLAPDLFLCDVDLAVDQFWVPSCRAQAVSYIKAHVHRYVLDLNRGEDQIHSRVVLGARDPLKEENLKKVLFWFESTKGEAVAPPGQEFKKLSQEAYHVLIEEIWAPYYAWIREHLMRLKEKFGYAVFIDAHSMPSVGTAFHGDLNLRADFVPGDCEGRSCHSGLTALFEREALESGYTVKVNDPYKGGNLTQHFGQPDQNIHALQIECNRALYMDEQSKEIHPQAIVKLQNFTDKFLREMPEFTVSK